MGERIHGVLLPKPCSFKFICTSHFLAFFVSLGLGHEEASKLHLKYYSEYGLALRGLTRHHNIGNVTSSYSSTGAFPITCVPTDPIEFDRQCDGSLPLEDMIAYQPSVRQLFQDIDRTKARVWALTNAYRPVRIQVRRVAHDSG